MTNTFSIAAQNLARHHYYTNDAKGLFMVDPSKVSSAFLNEMVRVEDPAPFDSNRRDWDIAMRTGYSHPMRAIIAKRDPDNPDRAKASVQVAFLHGLASNREYILDGADLKTGLKPSPTPTAATFYSVTKWNMDDNSIKVGDFIVDVATWLKTEIYPFIEHYGTLSPIKDFCTWLLQDNLGGHEVFCDKLLRSADYGFGLGYVQQKVGKAADFGEIAGDDKLQAALRQLAGYCIANGVTDGNGKFRSFDIVANFHQGNGAMPWDIHTGSDTTEIGMRRSGAVEANYRYPRDLEKLLANRASYRRGKPRLSDTVSDLLVPGRGASVPKAHDWRRAPEVRLEC
jgi:hypothetical protein